jgi:hypothetical protein
MRLLCYENSTYQHGSVINVTFSVKLNWNTENIIIIIIIIIIVVVVVVGSMSLFIGLLPLFQFLKPVHSR